MRVEAPNLGVILHDRLGQGIFSTHVHGQGVEIPPFKAGKLVRASLEVRMSLNPGAYGLVVVASARDPAGDPNRGVFLDRHADQGQTTNIVASNLYRLR